MKCIKLRTLIIFILVFTILLTTILYLSIIYIIKQMDKNKLSNTQNYMLSFNELSNYDDFTKYIIDEYGAKKVIALTFDDGPGKYTKSLLDILKENNAKATFFILGSCVSGNEQIITDAFLQGNEIATHGYSHKIMTKLDKALLSKDITQSLDTIEPNINEKITLIRPPYGIINKNVINTVEDLNLKIVKWDLDSLDWKLRNTEKITKRVLSQVNNGDIILMHDIYKTSVEATENIIKALKEEYDFITVSEMLVLKEHYKNSKMSNKNNVQN